MIGDYMDIYNVLREEVSTDIENQDCEEYICCCLTSIFSQINRAHIKSFLAFSGAISNFTEI